MSRGGVCQSPVAGDHRTNIRDMEQEDLEPEIEKQQDDILHYEGTSIRWKQFSTSFALATKKLSMGWSYAFDRFHIWIEFSDASYRYDDFAQCVPGWSSAEPRKAADVCRQMSDFIYDYLIVRPIISDPLDDRF